MFGDDDDDDAGEQLMYMTHMNCVYGTVLIRFGVCVWM